MAKPSTKGLLKDILSDDIEWIYVHISNKAIEWAVVWLFGNAIRIILVGLSLLNVLKVFLNRWQLKAAQ